MRKTITLLALSLISFGFLKAQNFPYGINYQAIARDANGNAKQYPSGVPIRFSINKTTAGGPLIWQETQTTPATNSMGQFNAIIGAGTTTGGGSAASFSAIDWSAGLHWLTVDIFNGSIYVPISSQQFQSVPYAMATPYPPVGSVEAYVGVIAPQGYLLCDGASLLKTSYPNLFAIMGTAYGSADVAHFNVPDFRGIFLRGLDGTAGNDPDKATRTASNAGGNVGNAVGSLEADAFQGHFHNINVNGSVSASVNRVGSISNSIGLVNGSSNQGGTVSIDSPRTDGANGTPQTSSETRPKNVYVNYIIKY